MQIYLLARVSSHRQEKEETVETQLDYLRRWSELNGHEIVDVFVDEAVSGTVPLRDRREAGRLLASLPTGRAAAVVVYRLDRLGRSALVIHEGLELFRRTDVEFISATENFDSSTAMGRIMLGLIALFAEFEREAMKQRCMDGKRSAAHKGQWMGGKSKYGYETDDEGRLFPSPEQSPIVTEIFQAVDERQMGLRRLAIWLEEQGVPSPSGGTRWHHNTLRKILDDAAYKGAAAWSGIEIPCAALVSEERFDRVQRTLHAPERRPHGRRKGCRAYLLTGLIRCGVCGRTYQGQRWKNGTRLPGDEHGYLCNGRIDGRMTGNRCQSPWLDGEIEEDILAACQAFLDDPSRLRRLLSEQRESMSDSQEAQQREKHRLQQQRAALREERAVLVNQLGKGRITDEDFDRRDAEIRQEDGQRQLRVESLERRLSALIATADEIAEREAMLADFRREDWGEEEKIRFLVQGIEVFPDAGNKARVRVSYWPSAQHGVATALRSYDRTMLTAVVLTYRLPRVA